VPGQNRAAEFLKCDSVEPIGHGEWSRAFFFRRAGRDLVSERAFGSFIEERGLADMRRLLPWSTLDIRQAAIEHFAAIGLPVPNFDARLRCCELAIGLDGLANQAYTASSADNLAWTAARLRHVLGT
jgi:hypothetical protein